MYYSFLSTIICIGPCLLWRILNSLQLYLRKIIQDDHQPFSSLIHLLIIIIPLIRLEQTLSNICWAKWNILIILERWKMFCTSTGILHKVCTNMFCITSFNTISYKHLSCNQLCNRKMTMTVVFLLVSLLMVWSVWSILMWLNRVVREEISNVLFKRYVLRKKKEI